MTTPTPNGSPDFPAAKFALSAIPPAPTMQLFHGAEPNRREVGRLDITEQGLTFEGDADASALALFEILKQMCDVYLRSKLETANHE